MRVAIYTLVDPRIPEVIRYVGQTTKPRERLRKHCKVAGRDKPTYRGHWIRGLLADGVVPTLSIVMWVKHHHKDQAEREMIRRMFAAGHPLVNGSLGGEGGALTPEIQARATAKLKAAVKAGTLKIPTMTLEQQKARDARLSALRSTVAGNPMKRLDVRAKNAASQRARAAARGYVPKVRVKRGTPEHSAMARKRNGKAVAASKAKAIERGGLVLFGNPVSLRDAAAQMGMSHKGISSYAKRHGITLQQSLDHYARKLGATPCAG